MYLIQQITQHVLIVLDRTGAVVIFHMFHNRKNTKINKFRAWYSYTPYTTACIADHKNNYMIPYLVKYKFNNIE